MKWTKILATIGTVLIVGSLTVTLMGYRGISDPVDITIEPIEVVKPNESRAGILEIGTGIWTCTVCGKINHNYKEIIEHFCKPDELECKHETISDVEILQWTCSCGKVFNTWEILMRNIPTWPDYIELEKDLWIDQKCVAPDGIHFEFYKYIFGKGTKIYFKD